MNSLTKNLCEFINDEVEIIEKLKELSLSFKDIVIKRDLKALEENNVSKKAILSQTVSLQRAKDALISELAVMLGLDGDSSVRDILDSKKLDSNSHKSLEPLYNYLEKKLKELDKINSLISTILLSSYRLNKTSIDIFNVNGTIDSTYSKNVKVSAPNHQYSKINHKV